MGTAAPAVLGRMWSSVAAAQTVLGKRRLYYQATAAENRLSDELSLIGMLHDWVPIAGTEATVLMEALRGYVAAEDDDGRDQHAAAVRFCVRAMTLSRARSATPYQAPAPVRYPSPDPALGDGQRGELSG